MAPTGKRSPRPTGGHATATAAGAPAKDQTCLRIEKMEADRLERRRTMQAERAERAAEEKRNLEAGNPGDVDFVGLVRRWREDHRGGARSRGDPPAPSLLAAAASSSSPSASSAAAAPKICIGVRKRPMSDRERTRLDHDSVTCLHPSVWVHSARLRVDGITKYLDHSSFAFDHAFGESATTEEVYAHCALPLVDFVCSGGGGRATVFAYGQTGSGKTHTMGGIQAMVAEDLFLLLGEASRSNSNNNNNGGEQEETAYCTLDDTTVYVTFFEIYGGRIQDLLHDRKRLRVLEDGKGEVQITGLEEFEAVDAGQLLALVGAGNDRRTTHATEANDTSSRSHAICQVLLRDKKTGRLRGKLSLVDLGELVSFAPYLCIYSYVIFLSIYTCILSYPSNDDDVAFLIHSQRETAGSERGTDTKSHNRQRRTESSEINTSLLALKECIRALDGRLAHVPYRASKLTLILKDCFTSSLARTAMIATVSPGASAADHTLNTLRYADRIKEKKVGAAAGGPKKHKTDKSRPKKSPKAAAAPPAPALAKDEEMHPEPMLLDDAIGEDEEQYDDDFDLLLDSVLDDDDDEEGGGGEVDSIEKLHSSVVQSLCEQEEELLNTHMESIQVS